MNPLRTSLDETDWKIIQELYLNPRINIKDLADKLDKSRNTIASRLKKMGFQDKQEENNEKFVSKLTDHENNNIIQSIIVPNYKRLGAISGFILATVKPNENQEEVAKKVAEKRGVEEVSVITGEWDLIIKINAETMEQIGNSIIKDLREESGIQKTITCISFWHFRGRKPFELLNESENINENREE